MKPRPPNFSAMAKQAVGLAVKYGDNGSFVSRTPEQLQQDTEQQIRTAYKLGYMDALMGEVDPEDAGRQ